MIYSLYAVFITAILLAAMVVLTEVGRRAGLRRIAEDGAGARSGFGAIDAAIFSLLGLMIAFTFSGAASRFDARRQLAIQEYNAIGTAWLRISVLPAAAQEGMRERFREYVNARLRVAAAAPYLESVMDELARCGDLQTIIWNQSVAACAESPSPLGTMLVLPALNQMFDIAAARTATAQIHPPLVVFATLFALALASALHGGYSMAGSGRRSWLHTIGFAAAVSIAVFLIIELEYPRMGLIRMDAMDILLADLLETMNKTS